MKISYFRWCKDFLEHIELGHKVQQYEVREIFANNPEIHRDGKISGTREYKYLAYGRTNAGRSLLVVFIYKKNERALIISAYDI